MNRWFRKHKKILGMIIAILLVVLLAAGSFAGFMTAILS